MSVRRFDIAWITAANIAKAKKSFVDILGNARVCTDIPEYGWKYCQGKTQ